MGTKTVDEDGAATGAEAAEAKRDDAATDVAATDAGDTTDTTDTSDTADGVTPAEAGTAADGDGDGKQDGPTGVGQGAGAVVSAALGLVSLTGGWIGTVASARETLVGQLETSTDAGVARQIQAVYGDAWQTTALWAGLFALAALITGVVVLARPAFGAPGRPQAPWIKSVAWAGITLGVIGVLLAVLKYTDALLGLPSAS